MNYVNKLLKVFNYSIEHTKAKNFENKTYKALNCSKKWIGNIVPSDILNIDLKESTNLIATLFKGGIFYEDFPEIILTTSESHIKNLFVFDDGRNYNHQVGELLVHTLCL
ncbi:MAG: hypothetical protein IKU37_02530 [Candidatus Gastranaerophilales bacterium]|nr:hypothetical protein [Candidatus Gastranaerophilales bacterium]